MIETKLLPPKTYYNMGQATSTPTSQNASSLAASTPAKCPVDHSQLQAGTSRLSAAENNRASTPAQCPVDHGKTNPLNQIPDLANGRQPGQTMKLPTERVESSIPRDGSEKWEYPSPQQFYNALVRKGWETPEEHIEVMVDIHNFLNEEAWREVQKWEKRQYEYVIFLTPGWFLLISHSDFLFTVVTICN